MNVAKRVPTIQQQNDKSTADDNLQMIFIILESMRRSKLNTHTQNYTFWYNTNEEVEQPPYLVFSKQHTTDIQ